MFTRNILNSVLLPGVSALQRLQPASQGSEDSGGSEEAPRPRPAGCSQLAASGVSLQGMVRGQDSDSIYHKHTVTGVTSTFTDPSVETDIPTDNSRQTPPPAQTPRYPRI